MKRKTVILLCFSAVLCLLSACKPEREKKGSYTKYVDKKNGYSGWVAVSCLGTSDEIDIEREIVSFNKVFSGQPCLKLSNEESFLMFEALKDYHYKDGEVYSVEICNDPDASRRTDLILCVEIIGYDEVSWVGFYSYRGGF